MRDFALDVVLMPYQTARFFLALALFATSEWDARRTQADYGDRYSGVRGFHSQFHF